MTMETDIPKLFGSMVFNDEVMRQRLSPEIYAQLKAIIENGGEMGLDIANAVAEAMKDWAIEKGATHYTHWFQPMTGITAEKHDSFLKPAEKGKVIMHFSGKQLVKGEPDASSFPSGGLRATFEARGYTAWDPTSYAFVKDGSLCIPTVFCGHNGEVLDKKTPLMRSDEAVGREALRILRLFGDTETKKVFSNAGAEQEYFLVDREVFKKRRDLVITGRTLFGSKPPKGQEMEDHYFGALRPRVAAFMHDLDMELWKLGVYAQTKHNEVAPGQHELAPHYTNVNLATDHNQLTMEIMKKVAEKHGLSCLLHEKPFRGVNGSGKHNNWSLSTDGGKNLLKPGKEPEKNKQFLLFICAVLKAVDEHQDLLRISVATAGNDRRLGGSEAPLPIISVFLGDDIARILESIEIGHSADHNDKVLMDTGISAVPEIWKDKTDRNRTSPFAFTGNKFEFRMPGSSLSIAGPNIMLNTMVADVLKEFADRLSKAENFDMEVDRLLSETVHEHKRIIFNGNNYADEWVLEAKRRGLLNLKTAADAIPLLSSPKNIELFERHKIFTAGELRSRQDILLENYNKVIRIEALTMIDMASKEILPACLKYEKMLAETAAAKKSVGIGNTESADWILLQKLDALCAEFCRKIDVLKENVEASQKIQNTLETAQFMSSRLHDSMSSLRATADALEELVSAEYWPFPGYCDLLFSV